MISSSISAGSDTRAADLLSQQRGVAFSQPMDQCFDRASSYEGGAMLLLGSRKTFSASNVDVFPALAYSWLWRPFFPLLSGYLNSKETHAPHFVLGATIQLLRHGH